MCARGAVCKGEITVTRVHIGNNGKSEWMTNRIVKTFLK